MTRRRKKRRIGKKGDVSVKEEEDKSSNWVVPLISDIISQHMKEQEDKSCSNCRIRSGSDILQRVENHITRLSSILSLSRDHTFILLLHYKWNNAQAVAVAWLDNEDSLRRTLGLLETPLAGFQSPDSMKCRTCFKSYHSKELDSASCGHMFCTNCWTNYIMKSIGEGPGCLGLRCPEAACYALVNRAMVSRLAPTKAKEEYERLLVLSYVEGHPKFKRCPAPDCGLPVEFTRSLLKRMVTEGGRIDEWNYDVWCRCLSHFCWLCTEEAHSPVDCDTARKWRETISSTKRCPKCKTQIENPKTTEGRITCGCGIQFCWICVRRRVCKSLHYYAERWLSYDISRKKALSYLREMQTVKIKEVGKIILEIGGEDFEWLHVVVEACKQIVECTRVLKWSYVYGYYNYNSYSRGLGDDEEEEEEEEKVEVVFFEYSLGEAECWLDKLRECAHKEIEQFLVPNNKDTAILGFPQFMHKLTALTKATRAYFEKLLRRLENDALVLDI